MWKAMTNLLTKAQETLGIEIPGLPDTGGITDTVTGVAESVGGQATEAVTGAAETVTDTAEVATSTVTDAGQTLSDAVGQTAGAAKSAG